jgi:hypothetical protein
LPPVGNDVVDLKHPENQGKSRDERFLGRVFTTEERDRIARAARPETLLWALWAAKEAAFKVVSRDDPTVVSTPRKYPVLLDEGSECLMAGGGRLPFGPVAFDAGHLPRIMDPSGASMSLSGRVITPRGEPALRIAVTDHYVHALSAATASDLGRIFQRVDRMDNGEDHGAASTFVRRALLIEIAGRLRCHVAELSVGKEPLGPGAPFVLRRGQPIALDISLSHDGRFAAFAFLIR